MPGFTEIVRPSPNVTPDRMHERWGVLFHHSVLSFEDTIALMTDPASEVSYHCLIAASGTRCTFVPDERIAWHAGASRFHGRSRCNDFLLGLAFAGDTYATPLTHHQIASALEWLDARWTRYDWSLDRIADHRTVAPGRKDDLAPAEWDRLHRAIAAHFDAA
ncbi:MAG TPA: N-acetylmuramoyl-L-alanine amidase [Opitutus sp.]|nr:N-acetylmuramoyl-L-alanine amidase [Opitutus sp.]